MQKRKKIIVVIAIIAVTIVGGIFIYKNSNQPENKEIKTDTSKCKLITDISEKDACYKQIAIEQSDASICGLMTYSDLYSSPVNSKEARDCYIQIAVAKKDFDICKSKLLWGDCYLEVAVATDNVSNCKKLTEDTYKYKCYAKFAEIKKDTSICESIIAISSEFSGSYYKECIAGARDGVNFDKISLDTNTWLTYKNEEYGFEFKYPKEITLIDKIKNGSLFMVMSADLDFSVAADLKSKLYFEDKPGGGGLYYYDEQTNKWMNKGYDDVIREISCNDKYNQFKNIGISLIPIFTTGTGDAGFALSVYFTITDKDFGIEISKGINSETTEKMEQIEDVMLNSFQLINNVKAVKANNCQ